MYIKNTWYPLTWSRNVGRTLARHVVIEEDLVVYRTEAGKTVALEDACPHKLAPLSIGTLKGDTVECGYHGLTFDCSGSCTRVPGQANVPASLKVRAYPTVENMGMVWVWMGDPALADPSTVFDLPEYHDAAYSVVEGDALPVAASYLNLADNLCDPSHVAFVHKSTLSNPEHGDVPVMYERQDGKVVTWRWIIDSPLIPIFQGLKPFEGNVDRWHYYHYYAPCIAVIDFGSAPTGTGAPEGNRQDAIQMFACHFITPVDATTCVQHWLCIKNLPADPATDRRLAAGLRLAFDEDKTLLEAIQRNEVKPRSTRPVKLAIDVSSVRMRRMVDEMIAAEQLAESPVATA